MFKPGSVDGRRTNSNKRTNQEHQSNITLYENKNIQSDNMNIIQHKVEVFYREYPDVTSFVTICIFISNCDVITHSFSVAVTEYRYIYFVIDIM